MLGQSLEHVGCETRHAKGDADVLIVEITVQSTMSCDAVFSCQGRFLRGLLQTFTLCTIFKNVQRVKDVQFATICCLLMPFSAVIQLLRYSSRERDSLLIKHIRSDNHFITQAEIFLHGNARLAAISSAGEAAIGCMYTDAVGDTLDK